MFSLLRRKHKVEKKVKKRRKIWIKRRITCLILKWQQWNDNILWRRQYINSIVYMCVAVSCLCSICKSGELASTYNDLLSRLLVHASNIPSSSADRIGQYGTVIWQCHISSCVYVAKIFQNSNYENNILNSFCHPKENAYVNVSDEIYIKFIWNVKAI